MFWLGKWVPHELIENQNAAVLKCLLLLYATTMNHFSIRLWHVSESGFYMTTSHAQLSGWTKKQLDSTFQSQTYIKKKWVMATLWWSAAHLIHYSFLNLSETITSKKYAQQNQWDVREQPRLKLALINRKGPILLHNQCFRSWTNWVTKFCFICHISPHLSPTDYHFFKHLDNFLQGKCFHKAENPFEEFVESRDMDFYDTGINKLTSH